MQGWLIVNGFVKSEKFKDIYSLFLSAAKKRGIELSVVNTVELAAPLDEDFFKNGKPDFAVFWDKDVILAHRLESAGIRLFNCADAVLLCDNKALTYSKLCGKVPMPKTLIAPKTFEGVGYSAEFLKKAENLIGFPMVVKQAYGSFGAQVYLAKDFCELEKIVEKIGWRDFLIQEYVASSCGKDVRVNVVGGKVVSSMLRFNDGDFRSNISNGGKMQRCYIPEEWKTVACKACSVLGLDFGGVDLMFGDFGKPILCEVNSNPHFRSTLMCTGVDMSEHIIDYVIEKLEN